MRTFGCLCVELKWFIEPAEVREVTKRSEELAKGVRQAKNIAEAYASGSERILRILDIEPGYDFLVAVGSFNWIGRWDVQDEQVPIIKVGHLAERLTSVSSLASTIKWLRAREYLPTQGKDFLVEPIDVQVGRWKSKWYGIGTPDPVKHGTTAK
jgi:hypothetical protein